MGERIRARDAAKGPCVLKDTALSTPTGCLACALVQEALERLSSNAYGLSAADAAARLETSGRNELALEAGPPSGSSCSSSVANPMIYLLGGPRCGLASRGARSSTPRSSCSSSSRTVIIGAFQEYRAEAALDALRQTVEPALARVLPRRRGAGCRRRHHRAATCVALETGDRVAADARLVTESDLRVDESALTGESEAVEKEPEPRRPDITLAGAARADGVPPRHPSSPGARDPPWSSPPGMNTVVGEIAGDVRSDRPHGDTPAVAPRHALHAAGHPVGGRLADRAYSAGCVARRAGGRIDAAVRR